MKNFLKFKKNIIHNSLFIILLIASFFRLYGLNWDQGQHLHPDERFLTMVLTSMKIPTSLSNYLNPKVSTMNPYNIGYSFFVYGTFPLYLTKVLGVLSGNNDYGTIHFVGRILSAFFDVGTVFLIYLISKKLQITNYKLQITPLLAAFLYSIMVLPIQLSHFFAVDTFLNFFIILSFYFLILLITNPPITNYQLLITSALLGGAFGLALACKISAALFLPIIGFGFFYLFFPLKSLKLPKLLKIFTSGVIFLFTSFLVFRLFQPSTFSSANFLDLTPNPQFLKNLKELKSFDNPRTTYPPAIQWLSTKPIIFPLKNLVLWGVGLPLGIIAILSVFYTIVVLLSCYLNKNKTTKSHDSLFIIHNSLILVWILLLFTYQGLQFAKPMRYFLPIYPFLALTSAILISKLNIKFIIFIIFITIIYPFSFLSIYSRPITRVTASKWIYENVPPGSTVSFEEWDDGLPLGLPNYPPPNFKTESFFMYDFDTPEKWKRINEKLVKVDYIFLTSNRAYGSTMKLPEKYPQTTAYYQSLFNGTGNFKKVAEFTSRPCFLPFGNKHWFCFNDDSADESFTVYDHPKVMIFQKSLR